MAMLERVGSNSGAAPGWLRLWCPDAGRRGSPWPGHRGRQRHRRHTAARQAHPRLSLEASTLETGPGFSTHKVYKIELIHDISCSPLGVLLKNKKTTGPPTPLLKWPFNLMALKFNHHSDCI